LIYYAFISSLHNIDLANYGNYVVSSLNAKYFYERPSIIPPNVNFAIKSDYLINKTLANFGKNEFLAEFITPK